MGRRTRCFVAASPAAQRLSEEAAVQVLQICLLNDLSFWEVVQPVQQLSVAAVRNVLFDVLDWYR